VPLNLRKGWYKASNGYLYIWEPGHLNADREAMSLSIRRSWLRCLGGLFYRMKRCIIEIDRGTTTGLEAASAI
jgi:hypothetical protein